MKIKTIDDMKKNIPEAEAIIKYIIERWKQGLYTLNLIAGLPGTGKSSVCQRAKEKIHLVLGGEPIIADIIDNFLDLIKFVQNANPNSKTPNIAVIEEVSVLFPSRRAMSTDNVDLQSILDTCRKRKVILFANAPLWPSIDSHMRSMANVYIQTIKVYKSEGVVFCKCYKLQTDPKTGKTYTHSFKLGLKDINRCYFNKPNSKLWEEYEKKKDSFLEIIYKRAEARQIKKIKKDDKLIEIVDTKKKSKELQGRELMVYDAYYTKGKTQQEIADWLGVKQPMISQILRTVNNKLRDTEDK